MTNEDISWKSPEIVNNSQTGLESFILIVITHTGRYQGMYVLDYCLDCHDYFVNSAMMNTYQQHAGIAAKSNTNGYQH